MTDESEGPAVPHPVAVFSTTHWSVVLSAGEENSSLAHEALSRLCTIYWYPLYAYVRRKGYNRDEAHDLTQEFFARLLARNYLRTLDRQKGKFRSFMLAAMEHFLAKEWRDARRLKRGGGASILSLDSDEADARYSIEPSYALTPERVYERRWATTLLEQAMKRLREEFISQNKQAFFDTLEPFLSGERAEMSYPETADKLDLTEGAVRVAVHRLRRRYGELVREEIAHTVSGPGEVDEDLRHLMAVLSS